MKFKNSLINILMLFFLSPGINGQAVKDRIYGGLLADIAEFPYMASLRRDGEHDCGGALISERHVLTAYHCVNSDHVGKLTVVVGTNSLTRGGQTYDVDEIHAYPPFDGNFTKNAYDHDIAVLTLKSKVTFSRFVSSIPLASSKVEAGVKVQFTGWGDDQSQQNTEYLQKLKVTTVYNNVCKTYYHKYGYGYLVRDNIICTIKGYGYGSCFGDSGGPLVKNGVLIGILSIAFGKCAAGLPDLYESVYYYLDFINGVIKNNINKSTTFIYNFVIIL